jgi:hypothetical protein
LSEQPFLIPNVNVMKDAPWTFDLADLAPAVLLFGHLGPVITEDWSGLFEREAVRATTSQMRELYSNLPAGLSQIQRLMLKPMVDLTTEEEALLTTTYGTTVNPIVQYLQDKAAHFAALRLLPLLPLRQTDTESNHVQPCYIQRV